MKGRLTRMTGSTSWCASLIISPSNTGAPPPYSNTRDKSPLVARSLTLLTHTCTIARQYFAPIRRQNMQQARLFIGREFTLDFLDDENLDCRDAIKVTFHSHCAFNNNSSRYFNNCTTWKKTMSM
jgi:hypothetical protein